MFNDRKNQQRWCYTPVVRHPAEIRAKGFLNREIMKQKEEVCEDCHGEQPADCICTYTSDYPKITLIVEFCDCCGARIGDNA